MTDPQDERPELADDDEHARHARHTKRVLQELVDDLARYGPGRSVTELRQRLEAAIAEAGLPEQPARWVQATAEEAARGAAVVLDATFAHDD